MKHVHRFIESYNHNGRIGVLVEVAFELSIAAQAASFAATTKDLAMHIAAMNPEHIDALLAQPFVKDASVTVERWLHEASATIEDKIEVSRFIRWDIEPNAPRTPPTEPPGGPAVAIRLGRRA